MFLHILKNMILLRLLHAKKLPIIIFVLLIVGVFLVFNRETYIEDLDRTFRLQKIHELIRNEASLVACKHPDLPVNSPDIMKFMKYVPPVDCTRASDDWVVCEGSECKISEDIKMRHGAIKCSFTDVIRVDDFQLTDGQTTTTDSSYKLEESDVVKVICYSEDNNKWSSTLTGIRFDKNIHDNSGWENVPNDGLKLNVIMFGFDSISRNTFIRKLPKSYAYMTDVLGSHILQGYNIVGDGTPQALIPILTGKTELELPDTRKRLSNTNFVNVYPFIWNDFKDIGYVTGYFEDEPNTGIFTYRLKGFDRQPTDHYMRPYYLSANKEMKRWPKLCSGSIPRHKVMMNQIKNFYDVYKTKPKFVFGFHGELSHDDYNLVGAADEDILDFLKYLHTNHILNNTIFIFMSDHGHRFADIRNTIQGKQEERLPFFSFTFPSWFKAKYSRVYNNFIKNKDRLVTPFDIYSTLKSVIHLENLDDIDVMTRSLSLFTKIPKERSCADAYIEPHWCACLEWQNVSLTDSIAQRLGNVLVETLNDYTYSYRQLCVALFVSQILSITKLQPNENLIKFNKNADIDGFVADLSAKTAVKTNTYQIKALLLPGSSLFEASITHNIENDIFDLKISDISRINKYGSQARCIENEYPHLRKFCYCK